MLVESIWKSEVFSDEFIAIKRSLCIYIVYMCVCVCICIYIHVYVCVMLFSIVYSYLETNFLDSSSMFMV